MKSYPTIVQFNEGRHSLLLRSISSRSSSRLTDTVLGRSDHSGDAVTYAALFEEYNKLVEMVLLQKTSRLIGGRESVQVNQYVLEGRLGRGRFGTVLRGRRAAGYRRGQQDTADVVALKCIMKRPVSSLFSMNQIMRKRARLQSSGGTSTGTLSATPESADKVVRRSSTKSLTSIAVGYLDSDWIMIEMNLLRIRKECLIHGQLPPHPHINRLLEIIDSPKSDRVWLVQEFASLGELQWERASKQQVPEQWCHFMKPTVTRAEFALKVLRDISLGLAFLQKHGIVHRDIKPSNILLDGARGTAKISDFGCSIVKPDHLPWWKHDPEKQRWSKAFRDEVSKIVGTPAFIPPELCDFTLEEEGNSRSKTPRRTTADYDPDRGFKVDIWSLGVTIYCILENRLPFFGENEFETYHMVVTAELPPLPEDPADPDLEWLYVFVTQGLLCKDWIRRPAAREVLTQLALHCGDHSSKMSKVKRKFSTWKRKIARSVVHKPAGPQPSESLTGTIFSHSSSSSNVSSIFTTDSSIELIESHR
ncbi:AaceriABR088Cp [[Ashbya] aceris (nom. inval.)]|nr:AaceriABR088Cp [[Ashbya] aceris (nom. inval.)]